METISTARAPLHPIIWIAALTVIVASGVGIAAVTGLIPEAKTAEPTAAIVPAPAVTAQASTAPAPSATVVAPTTEPKPVPHVAHKLHKTIAPPTATVPTQVAMAPPQIVPPPPPPICAACGVIDSVRAVTQEGQGSGLGAVAGVMASGKATGARWPPSLASSVAPCSATRWKKRSARRPPTRRRCNSRTAVAVCSPVKFHHRGAAAKRSSRPVAYCNIVER
jgi:hypothetical protein